MSCESIRADLVAYLQDELGEPRRVEIRSHLAGCRACAAELDDFSTARDAAKRVRVEAPSADFQKRVRERIASKVEEMRARGSVRFRTSRERVDAAQEWPGLGEWLRQRRRLGLMLLLAAAVLFPCAGLVWKYAIQPYKQKVEERRTAVRAELEWLQANYSREARRAAPRLDLEAKSDGTVAGLTFLADGPVRLVPGADAGPNDRFVLLYSAPQWVAFLDRLPGSVREETRTFWRSTRETSCEAPVAGAQVRLLKDLFEKLLGEPGEIAVLQLGDHAEIWVRTDLDAYLRAGAAVRQ
jgi:anti-sigma factor RsiW